MPGIRNKEHIRHVIDSLTIGQMKVVLHEINNNDLQSIDESRELKRIDTKRRLKMEEGVCSWSPNEIFDRWCEWNGFINYSETFRKVIGSIYGVDIDCDTMKLKKDQEEAMVIVGEILRMITSTEHHFEESMHEYICEKLDISDDYLDEIVEMVSKMNNKMKTEK